MKQSFALNVILLAIFSTTALFGQIDEPSAQRGLSKTIKELYNFETIQTLNISNKHGDISFINWDKDSISVTCRIFLEIFNEELAEEIFKEVKINNYTSGNEVFFKTFFTEDFHCNWPFSVDYTIYGPKKTQLTLSNNIGNITLDTILGDAKINLEYGSFKSHIIDSIALSLAFSDAKIDSTRYLQAKIAHTELEVTNSNTTSIESSYSKIILQSVKSLDILSNIDQIKAEQITNFNMEGNNSFVVVDTLCKFGKIKLNKGYLKILSVKNSFQEITIDNIEAPAILGISNKCGYTIHGQIKNGEFSHPKKENLTILRENESLSFSGTIDTLCQNESRLILFNSNAPIEIK